MVFCCLSFWLVQNLFIDPGFARQLAYQDDEYIAMIKKTYTVEGMHCTSCALMIESDLEDVGIKSTCSYAKQTLEVEFDEKVIKEPAIASIVQKAGYELVK